MDKIGEVIGPKGKVINAHPAGDRRRGHGRRRRCVGTCRSLASNRDAVYEAERQVEADPRSAHRRGGRDLHRPVVNITNFGAFVNILPGRDGLVHISKIGGGKRIDRVEDVLELGQELEVRVEDIDPNGKVSLIPADAAALNEGTGGGRRRSGGGSSDRDSGRRDRVSPRRSVALAADDRDSGRSRCWGRPAVRPRRSKRDSKPSSVTSSATSDLPKSAAQAAAAAVVAAAVVAAAVVVAVAVAAEVAADADQLRHSAVKSEFEWERSQIRCLAAPIRRFRQLLGETLAMSIKVAVLGAAGGWDHGVPRRA